MNGLKSSFLSGIRPFYGPEDDRRAAAQAEREKIKVENIKKTEVKEEEKEDEEVDDKTKSEKVSEEGKDDTEESEEEVEDEIKEEEKELSLEDYKKELAKAQKAVERLQKRVGKTTGEKNAFAQELAAAKKTLAAKVEEGTAVLTEDDVEQRAEAKAEQKANDREFQKAVTKLIKSATKTDPKFEAKMAEAASDFAPIPQLMIATLEDLDNENGGEVLAYLADNPDEYGELLDVSLARMSNRINKISDKLKEAKTAKPKKISKVPEPIDTIKGSDKSPTQLPANPTKNMAEFVAMREKQVAARRKAKYGN